MWTARAFPRRGTRSHSESDASAALAIEVALDIGSYSSPGGVSLLQLVVVLVSIQIGVEESRLDVVQHHTEQFLSVEDFEGVFDAAIGSLSLANHHNQTIAEPGNDLRVRNGGKRRSVDNDGVERPLQFFDQIFHFSKRQQFSRSTVSYTHLRAHETPEHLVCRLLLE